MVFATYTIILFLSGGWVVLVIAYPDVDRYVQMIDQMAAKGIWIVERTEIANYSPETPGAIFCLRIC